MEQNAKSLLLQPVEWTGDITIFIGRVIRSALAPPFAVRELVRQMYDLGVRSLPIVALAGAALGAVLSMQLRESMTRFGAKALIPAVIILSIIKETGPIITALVVSGRVGAGIGAELGSMQVTEQIDAMEVSAVDPFKLLVATRILACMLVLPVLTIFAGFCGTIMGWLAGYLAEPMSLTLFLHEGFEQARYSDLVPATFKTTVFGFIIGAIGCYQGMRAKGGTEGVGRSTTTAVVLSSLFVIVADVLLVRLILAIWG